MATALMALAQSLATQGQDTGKPQEQQEEPRELVPMQGAKSTPDMLSAIFHELVQVSKQISNLDKLVADSKKSAPLAGGEAQHWYAISLQAMKWSRTELEQRLQGVLAQLRALVQADGADAEASSRAGLEAAHPVETVVALAAGDRDNSEADHPTLQGTDRKDIDETDKQNLLAVDAKQNEGSLRVDLEILREQNPACCFIVRRIKKLGLESPARLEEHFSQYGGVLKVLVAHSFERPSPNRKNGRVRPAALGFIIMESAEAVVAVMEAGVSHEICGTTIGVQRFESFSDDLASLGGAY